MIIEATHSFPPGKAFQFLKTAIFSALDSELCPSQATAKGGEICLYRFAKDYPTGIFYADFAVFP